MNTFLTVTKELMMARNAYPLPAHEIHNGASLQKHKPSSLRCFHINARSIKNNSSRQLFFWCDHGIKMSKLVCIRLSALAALAKRCTSSALCPCLCARTELLWYYLVNWHICTTLFFHVRFKLQHMLRWWCLHAYKQKPWLWSVECIRPNDVEI